VTVQVVVIVGVGTLTVTATADGVADALVPASCGRRTLLRGTGKARPNRATAHSSQQR
jgi:hypothetical protein